MKRIYGSSELPRGRTLYSPPSVVQNWAALRLPYVLRLSYFLDAVDTLLRARWLSRSLSPNFLCAVDTLLRARWLSRSLPPHFRYAVDKLLRAR
jgi:hypothetical protein